VVPDARAPGGFIYRPDPRHPMHPYNMAHRKRPELRRRLDEDPALQDYIRDHREPFASAFQQFALHRVAVLASDPTDRTKQQTIADGAQVMATKVIGTLDAAAERLAIRDVPPGVLFKYLVEHLVPEAHQYDWLTAITRSEPVGLFIAADGMITMVFTGASANERAEYEDLIKRAQRFFSYPVSTGGRPRRRAKPLDRPPTDPRAVARLRRQGRSIEDVARILQAVYPHDEWVRAHETGIEDRIAQRVERYAADGAAMLDEPGRDSPPDGAQDDTEKN
jgi:hypothetical protein